MLYHLALGPKPVVKISPPVAGGKA
jgi:hypothetical protein